MCPFRKETGPEVGIMTPGIGSKLLFRAFEFPGVRGWILRLMADEAKGGYDDAGVRTSAWRARQFATCM